MFVQDIRWTYAYAPVDTTGNEMHIVELQSSDWASVTDETSVYLSASQIPQAHHAVCGTTSERSVEDLHGAYEVG
jgi:hypothetical protein